MDGAGIGYGEAVPAPGTAVVTTDGQYVDADPVALDLYGVTLDVLREKRVGDFSPADSAELERRLWSLWVLAGLEHAEGGGTVVRPDGQECRVWVALDGLPQEGVRLTLEPVAETVRTAPSLRVQNLLGHWRDLERHLAEVPPGDPARAELEGRIEAVREEYQRRVGGR